MSSDTAQAERRAELEQKIAAYNEALDLFAADDPVAGRLAEQKAELERELEAQDAPPQAPAPAVPDPAIVPGEPGWEEPTPDVTTAPPPSAPVDPVAAVAAEHPGETISETSYDVVAEDGSTARNTPGYSPVPCPVCGNTSVKTTNVDAAIPKATLQGDTVNPGDQVVVCESCSTTIAKGDIDQYHEAAKSGVYGDEVKAAAEGADEALTAEAEAELEADVAVDELELAEFRAWKAQQAGEPQVVASATGASGGDLTTTTEGGTGGDSETKSGGA